LRLQAIGVSDKPQLKPEAIESSEDAYLGEKTAASGEVMRLYDREKLTEGELIAGSALIFQLDSTIYIPPSWSARIDRYYNLVLQRNAD
jgi:N-methylhydantoinase A